MGGRWDLTPATAPTARSTQAKWINSTSDQAFSFAAAFAAASSSNVFFSHHFSFLGRAGSGFGGGAVPSPVVRPLCNFFMASWYDAATSNS